MPSQAFLTSAEYEECYKIIRYGIKRLVKVEKSIEGRLKRQPLRYKKTYPEKMFHVDTTRLPLLKGEVKSLGRKYLFVGIDDSPKAADSMLNMIE